MNRFEIVHKEGSMFNAQFMVLVDRETGVNYLFTHSGNAGGLTPLLDAQGQPIITK